MRRCRRLKPSRARGGVHAKASRPARDRRYRAARHRRLMITIPAAICTRGNDSGGRGRCPHKSLRYPGCLTFPGRVQGDGTGPQKPAGPGPGRSRGFLPAAARRHADRRLGLTRHRRTGQRADRHHGTQGRAEALDGLLSPGRAPAAGTAHPDVTQAGLIFCAVKARTRRPLARIRRRPPVPGRDS